MKNILTDPRRFYTLLFIASVLLTFGVRSLIYHREAAAIRQIQGHDFIPFLVESAIMYGYAGRVADGRSIGGRDADLGGMESVPVASQMLLGMEYFLGWSYRLKNMLTGKPVLTADRTAYEDNPDFAAFVRRWFRAWGSLVGGLIFLWLILLRVRWLPAVSAVVFYAVAPAGIARCTGQDLVREGFAMPFILGTLVIAAWIMRRPSPFKYLLLCLSTLASFSFWDAPQMFFLLWAMLEMLRLAAGGGISLKRRNIWLAIYVGIVLAAILNPYQRYHGLVASPTVMVAVPLLLIMMFSSGATTLKRYWIFSGAAAVVLVILWKILPGYGENYSHFGSLIAAKLRFLNVKPADPRMLDFDARILWTPAMHSANTLMTFFYYPAGLWFTAGLGVFMLCRKTFRKVLLMRLGRDYQIYAFAILFFGMYIFFVRAHVFCIIFVCMSFALLLDNWWRVRRRYGMRNLTNRLVLAAAAVVVLLELGMSSALRRNYAAGYFRETAGLIRWFRACDLRGITVLADMNLSPVLKGYCDVRIITQPQFELKKVRDMVRDYIMLLYHGNEKELAAFCERYGIDLVIFDRANSYDVPMHIYSSRYMAAAGTVNPDSPVWLMEKYPRAMRYFHPITPPEDMEFIGKTYRVFRYISDEHRDQAVKSARLAEYFHENGKDELARKMAEAAYAVAPNIDRAYLAYYKVFNRIPDDSLCYLGRMRRHNAGKE